MSLFLHQFWCKIGVKLKNEDVDVDEIRTEHSSGSSDIRELDDEKHKEDSDKEFGNIQSKTVDQVIEEAISDQSLDDKPNFFRSIISNQASKE